VSEDKTLYVVHCIDTEGPLNETLEATFSRLENIFGVRLEPTRENLLRLQNKDIDLGGIEEAVAKCFSPKLLSYNATWDEIEEMLDGLLADNFRNRYLDDFGRGWVCSWHCMDHIGYSENPRHKDVGYGNVFHFYQRKLNESGGNRDEINWHFHPLSLTRNPLHAATSYLNSYDVLLQILCRRIIEDNWFPVVNRPGFHSERPDSHAFLEQCIPFDFANQSCDEQDDQPDMLSGRFGDWRRAPKTWRGYHPSHDDYQVEGSCRRTIFRCLNVGTRLRELTINHVREAFLEARHSGAAVLAFADHDYRDIRPDIDSVREMLFKAKKEFSDVKIKFSGAEEAAVSICEHKGNAKVALHIALELIEERLFVTIQRGEIFGPQPFLAICTKEGHYYHDNLDVIDANRKWAYTLDEQTVDVRNVAKIGVGAAGKYGGYCVAYLDLQGGDHHITN